MSEFYQHVPKDYEPNLQYRLKILKRANGDVGFQKAMIQACSEDFLFMLSAFSYLYEPRPRWDEQGRRKPNIIPFIPWPNQEVQFRLADQHLGKCDIGADKSRGEGASWMLVYFAVRDFLFRPMSNVGLISKDRDSVDTPGNMDSLMAKVDFALKKLPTWMAGTLGNEYIRNRANSTLQNNVNGSMISGFSSTGDAASGARKTWLGLDELSKFPRPDDTELMASTQPVTDCRFFVSTPKGSEGAFYELMHRQSRMIKLVFDWRENISKNRGLYRMVKGKPVALSADNPLPPEYDPPNQETLEVFARLRRKGFNLEAKTRSPWYDGECDRAGASPQNIAQELDRDYGGSLYHYFGTEFQKVVESTVRPHTKEGNFSVHPEELEGRFDSVAGGPLKIWTELNTHGEPPNGDYAIGADIATGLGGDYSSNSVLCVLNLITHEQVAEYAINTMPPSDFADLAIALCKWYHTAFLCYEANGSTGTEFGKRIKDQRYGNIFYRSKTWLRGNKKTKEPGFWNAGDKGRGVLFGDMERCIRAQEYAVRSRALMEEFPKYIFEDGKIVHETSRRSDNEAAKGLAHGDRVIAFGCAIQAAQDRLGNKKWKPLDTEGHTELDEIDKLLAKPEKEDDEWDERSAIDLVKRR